MRRVGAGASRGGSRGNLSLSNTHIHTHTHTLSLSLSLSHTHTHTHTHKHIHTHTHTHTHTQTHTHTLSLALCDLWVRARPEPGPEAKERLEAFWRGATDGPGASPSACEARERQVMRLALNVTIYLPTSWRVIHPGWNHAPAPANS